MEWANNSYSSNRIVIKKDEHNNVKSYLYYTSQTIHLNKKEVEQLESEIDELLSDFDFEKEPGKVLIYELQKVTKKDLDSGRSEDRIYDELKEKILPTANEAYKILSSYCEEENT